MKWEIVISLLLKWRIKILCTQWMHQIKNETKVHRFFKYTIDGVYRWNKSKEHNIDFKEWKHDIRMFGVSIKACITVYLRRTQFFISTFYSSHFTVSTNNMCFVLRIAKFSSRFNSEPLIYRFDFFFKDYITYTRCTLSIEKVKSLCSAYINVVIIPNKTNSFSFFTQ